MSNTRLSDFFVSNSILTPEQWAGAEQGAAVAGQEIVAYLVDTQVVPIAVAAQAVAHARRWKFVSLTDISIPTNVIDVIDAATAHELKILPIKNVDGEITFACGDPDDLDLDKQLRSLLGRKSSLVSSSPDELDQAINSFYSDTAQAIKAGAAAAEYVETTAQAIEVRDINDENVINQLLNNLLNGAITKGSTDVHIEGTQDYLSIRYGFGRKLRDQPRQRKEVTERLINLIKTKAKLKPTTLLDQNGTLEHEYRGRKIDIRVAVLPAQWSESLTLRIAVDTFRDLEKVGFTDYALERWMDGLQQPSGACIVSGPMKSGKTTTNMASVGYFMKDRSKKIISLEDPVEVKLPEGITQVSIDKDKGLTWERTLGTVLRSTASVLFLGEINQDEIAHMALQAAGTGHLVLSTIHTNDAPGVILRLREMGIKPSVIADNLRTVCAQRLPDRLCECKVLTRPTERQIRDFQLSHDDIHNINWYGPGGKIKGKNEECPKCLGTGYIGSVPIHEIMTFPEEIRELIIDSRPTSEVRTAAKKHGMITLQEDGLEKVKQGLTSLQELRSQLLID